MQKQYQVWIPSTTRACTRERSMQSAASLQQESICTTGAKEISILFRETASWKVIMVFGSPGLRCQWGSWRKTSPHVAKFAPQLPWRWGWDKIQMLIGLTGSCLGEDTMYFKESLCKSWNHTFKMLHWFRGTQLLMIIELCVFSHFLGIQMARNQKSHSQNCCSHIFVDSICLVCGCFAPCRWSE